MYALRIAILSWLFMSCTTQKALSPTGTTVPVSEYPTLQAKYSAEIDARHEELELWIELPKVGYSLKEIIELKVTLTNRAEKDVIVRKPDAQTNRVSAHPNIGEIIFVVIPSDPAISLNFPALVAPYPGSLVTPPDDFILLHSSETYTTSIALPQPLDPIPQGQYSVYLKYRNYRFGADGLDNSREFFIDYHAWMGETDSNTVVFDIKP